jgi:hypothetical protein
VDERTIEYIRSRLSAPVACWNPDSPYDYAISNRGAGIPAAVGAYDVYITWADDVAARLRFATSRVIVIPFGWDSLAHQPAAAEGVTTGRVVFVGTGSAQRQALLRQLADFQPIVFGSRWTAIPGVEIHPPVYGPSLCPLIVEARWTLNLLNPQNAVSHNMRTFEIPGMRGNQVAPHTADHARFLGTDSRTLLFRSLGELRSLLRTSPDDLPQRRRDVLEGHTYVDRVMTLLQALGIGGG